MNKGALGLAYAARKVVIGQEEVVKALQKKQLHLVLLATDASDNTTKKIKDKTNTYQIQLIHTHTSLDISSDIGKKNIKVIGIKDKGFSMMLK
ncbi:ribosomal L7Ae/L30e/S12e/Gadd45 family protein [Acholeplasma laidlawii]|uniref:L7Ae/L30e/S12e/Gadd45 family ribosomal protein n=1 Tax=Acholeplasma laidlawii TaxID=2148 RepID=UPI0015A90DD2|nr:ribosomal L7Ae/L30e/S12e/Gadd45 family protein [Acholeplasma laidlawii]NWH11883.1 ribosomal L7Ae/L30e/S12e/Gadd45 family protein [Acholeplasma laidlawii]